MGQRTLTVAYPSFRWKITASRPIEGYPRQLEHIGAHILKRRLELRPRQMEVAKRLRTGAWNRRNWEAGRHPIATGSIRRLSPSWDTTRWLNQPRRASKLPMRECPAVGLGSGLRRSQVSTRQRCGGLRGGVPRLARRAVLAVRRTLGADC